MNRKIKTSCSRRPFFHQKQNTSLVPQANFLRPPTSQSYVNLYQYRSNTRIKNQYESNYFTVKLFNDKKQTDNVDKQEKLIKNTLLQVFDDDLPKSFRFLMTQLKVLLKESMSEEVQATQIIKNFSKKIKAMHQENNNLKHRIQSLEKELSEGKYANEKLRIRIKDIQQQKSNHTQKEFPLTTQSKKPPSQFQLMMQNLHLTQLNNSYISKINELKQMLGQEKVEIKKSNCDSDSSTDILRYHNRINYLEMKVTNCQNIQNQLLIKNQNLEVTVQSLNQQIVRLTDGVTKIIEQRNQWRQRALMQKQDSETNLSRQNFLLYSIRKLREMNKNLTQKLLNISSEDGVQKIKQLQHNPYFQYEVDFFKSLKTVYFEAKLKEFRLMIQNKKDSFEIEPMGLEQEYLDYRKHQQVNLVILNYSRPTFFSFIEEIVTNDIYTCRVKGNTSISRIFVQILRGILNCKINEFFLSNGEEKYTRFPQFVYSWFEKFYFNSEKNHICALEPFMQKPVTQDVFYKDLMNVKLDQSWEIITFREFLLEQLNLEQLYFYLISQNLLYKKGGITQQIQYLGDFCILVEFSAAKSVLDLVLSDFQSWNLSFLTSKLREKIVVKKNVEYIESGFFLRCLIEYYKIERINRYKYIAKLCDEFKSCEQNGLRFSSFISVINRFTEITAEEKVRIYRNCFSVSRGKINADSIFTVCTEQLIFLRYLKMKCFYKLPTLVCPKEIRKNKKKNQEEDKNSTKRPLIWYITIYFSVQPSDSYYYEIFIGLNRLMSNEKSFLRRIQKFGVFEIIQHFQTVKKLFNDRSSNIDNSLLRCRHFIHFVSTTMHKIRQISFQNFYNLLQQTNKKKVERSFWVEIQQSELCDIFVQEFKITFKVFEKINQYRLWKEQVYNFRVNNAARKIQRQVRKKFIEPFMQLYKIIYSKLKKQEDNNTKTQQT